MFKLPNSIHTIIIYNAQRRYDIIARICFFRCMNVNAISRLKLKNYLASSLNRSTDFELFICLTHNTKRYPYAISSVVKRSDARELCARISLHLYRVPTFGTPRYSFIFKLFWTLNDFVFFFFLFQRQQLQSTGPVGAEKRPATGGRARDANLHAYIRIGRGRKREHVHSDSQEQVHAHGHQLLPVQSSRVGPAVARVRIAAGDLPNMVQVYIHAEPSIFIFFYTHPVDYTRWIYAFIN